VLNFVLPASTFRTPQENWPCLQGPCSHGNCWCLQIAAYSLVKQVLPAAINKPYAGTKIASVQPDISLLWTACSLTTPAHQKQCCSARAAVSSAICFGKIWSSPVSQMHNQTISHATLITLIQLLFGWLH